MESVKFDRPSAGGAALAAVTQGLRKPFKSCELIHSSTIFFHFEKGEMGMTRFGMKLKLVLGAIIILMLAAGCATPPPPPEVPPDPCAGVSPLDDIWRAGWAQDAGCYDQAMLLLNCSIDSGELPDRELAIAYNFRGLTYLKTGDCNAAIADLSKAIDMFPLYSAAYLNRGAARKACGDMAGAMKDFARFKKLAKLGNKPGFKPGPRKWPADQVDCPVP